MLINIEKIKSCESIKLKLPEHIFDEYIQNVCEYFALLENINNVKPGEAVDVVSALVSFREYFDIETEWERLTLHTLDTLRKGINRSFFDKISVFGGMAQVAFSVSALSLAAPKIEPFLKSVNEILLNNLAEYLGGAEKEDFYTLGNYEVINGLSGPLRYLLDFSDDEKMNEMAKKIIDIFIKRSKDKTILGKKVPGWHYYTSEVESSFMNEQATNGVVNYGVSHGMGGPLAALAIAYNKGFRTEGLLEAINGLISEYMNVLYYVNDIAYFPGRITFEQYVGNEEFAKAPSQMSWCYGSVGILRALYISGNLLSNEKVKQFAQDELIKIAKMELSDYQLMQPIVCHGYIGTAAILNLMYLDTNRIEFLQKTTEMLEASVVLNIERFVENEKQLANVRNTTFRVSLHNHLEGYNGIMQTALSIIKGHPTENEERLLMI
ncbi:MAG: lanthionine synthetase C family protein [Oscillospiraceae bacterium]|nr:lanthionine synthetase C family protein [Oscillospiraceae bacterium]